jgi:hypothetical protein
MLILAQRFASHSLNVVPSVDMIKEIAGEGAVEVTEEYQDVYMCVRHRFSLFAIVSQGGVFGSHWWRAGTHPETAPTLAAAGSGVTASAEARR